MKRLTILSVLIGLVATVAVAAIDFPAPYSGFDAFKSIGPGSSQIKGIQVFGRSSGIAYPSHALYRTDDNGETWRRVSVPVPYGHRLVSAHFADEAAGTALAADGVGGRLWLLRTEDGGLDWSTEPIILERDGVAEDFTRLNLDSARFRTNKNGVDVISATAATSSNFRQTESYSREPGETVWKHSGSYEEPIYSDSFRSRKEDLEEMMEFLPGRMKAVNIPADPVIAKHKSDAHAGHSVHSDWYLTQNGSCAGYKSGCVQTTRLYKNTSFADEAGVLNLQYEEITPPDVTRMDAMLKEAAKAEAESSRMFARGPGGSIRTSLNRGFDKCQAGTVAQMQLWWDNSYFFDSNIYFSGRARACPNQPFTGNPAWIDQVSAQGWGFIPTVVGYQSPCSVSSTVHKHSSDPAMAEQQGRGEADIAAADAAAIGLTAGSVIYYDMEQYNVPSPDTGGCRAATVAFLKGWTERIKQLGYVSGVYGSPRNAQEDWVGLPAGSRMDAIWMARWDNVPSVWTYILFPNFPTNVWNNHQRIKQWQAPHNETWGGVTFNIDGNISDGPVSGIPFSRNKAADFDGDGKTDVSVFRPGTGEWFIYGSLGPTFSAQTFGVAGDLLTPGDYDGDGKTDVAVFRPADSMWYFRTKGSFTGRQWGQAGDIPTPADFDGDKRTDIAVFRPATGTWYISFNDSLNSFGQVQFGQNGDRPAAGDYDGDGRTDIAVWRPSEGTWYVLGTASGFYGVQWGEATDVPAPADYDGDSRTDFAVFRGSTGTWHLLQSAEGTIARQFGQNGDLAVSGDYDGDGRYDVAVFRPSNNTWYVRQNTGDYTAQNFGTTDDKPIPMAYLPR